MYIDDSIKGIADIMESEIRQPINLGSSEMVSINQLEDIADGIAGVELTSEYSLCAAKRPRSKHRQYSHSEAYGLGAQHPPS